MTEISEPEFARICRGIYEDRETILKHNPIGTHEQTLFWMLSSCLISYLSLSEIEIPCFTGVPDAKTYRNAILFILRNKSVENFNVEKYLDELSEN